MTYVYRDPDRLRGCPVHQPEPVPEQPLPPQQQRPAPPPPPLGPPVWGGPLGLQLAAAESVDFERRYQERTIARARIIAATEEIREHNRVHGWKPKPPRRTQ